MYVGRRRIEGLKKEEESERMVHWREEGKAKQFFGGRHRRNLKWRGMSQEEMDKMLEKACAEDGGRGPGQVQGGR